jgi:hypothetical protein
LSLIDGFLNKPPDDSGGVLRQLILFSAPNLRRIVSVLSGSPRHISILILTRNEERGLPAALASEGRVGRLGVEDVDVVGPVDFASSAETPPSSLFTNTSSCGA